MKKWKKLGMDQEVSFGNLDGFSKFTPLKKYYESLFMCGSSGVINFDENRKIKGADGKNCTSCCWTNMILDGILMVQC